MNKTILLLSYELNKNAQRGIYQFSKSLVEAIDENGIKISLFTQAYPSNDDKLTLHNIYKSLNDPRGYFLKGNHAVKILKHYSLNLFKNSKFDLIENNINLMKDEAFFEKFDLFINKPIVYYENNIDLLFFKKFYEKDFVLPQFSNNDIIFTSSPLSIKSSKHKVVQTVHDLIPLEHKGQFTRYFRKRIESCSHANKILCVSEYSKQQYLEYFPTMDGKVEVVYQPLPADKHTIYLSSLPEIQQQVLDKYNLKSKQYMYYVGAIEERKNIHNLIKAYEISTDSDKSCPLVISGSVDGAYSKKYNLDEYLVSYSNFHKATHNIMKTNFVSDVEKLCLIRNSRAFLFPSLSEGFGIPVIEAQTLGVPVMTSNNTSLPEVTNGSAILLKNPLDIDEMVANIKKLWVDDEYCASLIELGNQNALRFTKENFKDAIGHFLSDI